MYTPVIAAFGVACSDDDEPVASTGGGGGTPPNKVLMLDGVDDHVTVDIADHTFGTFTLECRIMVPNYDKNVHYISLHDNAYLVLGDYGLADDGQISTWASGLNPVDAGGAGVEPVATPNAWHHIAFTYDGVNQYCLLDGNVVITAPTTGTLTVDALWVDGLNIGSRFTDGSQFVEGYMDEVRLWNVYRTPAQIQANMNGAISPQTGLIGYWNFDGNNANDLTTNAAHGTLQNGATIVDAP